MNIALTFSGHFYWLTAISSRSLQRTFHFLLNSRWTFHDSLSYSPLSATVIWRRLTALWLTIARLRNIFGLSLLRLWKYRFYVYFLYHMVPNSFLYRWNQFYHKVLACQGSVLGSLACLWIDPS